MTKKVKVSRIIDGDTFVGKSDGQKEEFFRLSGVDTPEKKKPGFSTAKTALKGLIEGKTVSVDKSAIGHFGRSIVDVKTSSGKSVNNAMKKHDKKNYTKKTTPKKPAKK